MAHFITKMLKSRSETFARYFYNIDGYNQYGLYHDDLIGGYHSIVNPKVSEAYRRLLIDKPDEHDKRVYRGLRAVQLQIQKKILPKEEWVTYEEDMTKGYYLQPYLAQIEKEEEEKRAFAILDSD